MVQCADHRHPRRVDHSLQPHRLARNPCLLGFIAFSDSFAREKCARGRPVARAAERVGLHSRSMTTILFVRCDASETFGVAPAAVESAGATVRVWNALETDEPRPWLDDVGGVVVFGSTFNVKHADEQPFIKETADVIREAIEPRIPYLGVCFGGQLLAWALDAQVGEGPIREIGFEPIRPTPGCMRATRYRLRVRNRRACPASTEALCDPRWVAFTIGSTAVRQPAVRRRAQSSTSS